MNKQHLSECIMHLLVLYDDNDRNNRSDTVELVRYMEKLSLNDNRQQMEALYILLNMGNVEALRRALSLSPDLRYKNDIIK